MQCLSACFARPPVRSPNQPSARPPACPSAHREGGADAPQVRLASVQLGDLRAQTDDGLGQDARGGRVAGLGRLLDLGHQLGLFALKLQDLALNFCAVQCRQYSTVQYSKVRYSTVYNSTVQYSSVQIELQCFTRNFCKAVDAKAAVAWAEAVCGFSVRSHKDVKTFLHKHI